MIHLNIRQWPETSRYTRAWRAIIDTNPNYDVLLHPTWYDQNGSERIGITYFIALQDARHHAVGALIDVLCQRFPTVGPFKLDALVYEQLWLGEYTGRAIRIGDGVEVTSFNGGVDIEPTETCFVDWSYLHTAVETLRAARAELAEAGEDSIPDPPYEIVLPPADDDAPLSEVRVVAAAHPGLACFFQSLLALTPEKLDTVLPLRSDSLVNLSGIHAFSYDRWFVISAWDEENSQALALVFLRISTLKRMIGEVLGVRDRLNHSEA